MATSSRQQHPARLPLFAVSGARVSERRCQGRYMQPTPSRRTRRSTARAAWRARFVRGANHADRGAMQLSIKNTRCIHDHHP